MSNEQEGGKFNLGLMGIFFIIILIICAAILCGATVGLIYSIVI